MHPACRAATRFAARRRRRHPAPPFPRPLPPFLTPRAALDCVPRDGRVTLTENTMRTKKQSLSVCLSVTCTAQNTQGDTLYVHKATKKLAAPPAPPQGVSSRDEACPHIHALGPCPAAATGYYCIGDATRGRSSSSRETCRRRRSPAASRPASTRGLGPAVRCGVVW